MNGDELYRWWFDGSGFGVFRSSVDNSPAYPWLSGVGCVLESQLGRPEDVPTVGGVRSDDPQATRRVRRVVGRGMVTQNANATQIESQEVIHGL